MRNIASILILALAFTFTSQAQEKRKKKQRPELSIEQRTELMVKQLTLTLDLSEKQQNQILPLLKAQEAQKKVAMDQKKEMQKNGTRPTADQIFEMKSKILDERIAFKSKMKKILDEEQFEKFEKMARAKEMRKREMMGNRMEMRKDQMFRKEKRN